MENRGWASPSWSDKEAVTALAFAPDDMTLATGSLSLTETQEKMEEYRNNGARLGWLIHPSRKQVHIYRLGQPVQVLDNPQSISGDPELPGFLLDLEPVWRA